MTVINNHLVLVGGENESRLGVGIQLIQTFCSTESQCSYIDLVISSSTKVLGLKAVALAVAKVRKLVVAIARCGFSHTTLTVTGDCRMFATCS